MPLSVLRLVELSVHKDLTGLAQSLIVHVHPRFWYVSFQFTAMKCITQNGYARFCGVIIIIIQSIAV